jgi:hypothetical protein
MGEPRPVGTITTAEAAAVANGVVYIGSGEASNWHEGVWKPGYHASKAYREILLFP